MSKLTISNGAIIRPFLVFYLFRFDFRTGFSLCEQEGHTFHFKWRPFEISFQYRAIIAEMTSINNVIAFGS